MELRYPAAHETTRSRIGIPASASAIEAALIHAALVPATNQGYYNETSYLGSHVLLGCH